LTFFAFGVLHLAPGDPATEYLRRTTDAQPTPAAIAATRRELGLDRPLVEQYVSWLGGAVRGDLGISYGSRRPVAQELRHRVEATVELAVPAAALALLVAVPVGVLSAVYRNRLVDQVVRIVSLAGASVPGFWLALLLMLLFAVRLSLVDVAGREHLSSAVLPAVTLALRNALVPVVTTFGNALGHLVAGTVVIETIFAWPGLGKLTIDAIQQRDYPMLQGVVLFAGAAFVAINLVVDLTYGVIDPRIRLGRPLTGQA
jgi:peptide/nickel transport system permease protein